MAQSGEVNGASGSVGASHGSGPWTTCSRPSCKSFPLTPGCAVRWTVSPMHSTKHRWRRWRRNWPPCPGSNPPVVTDAGPAQSTNGDVFTPFASKGFLGLDQAQACPNCEPSDMALAVGTTYESKQRSQTGQLASARQRPVFNRMFINQTYSRLWH